MFRFLRHTAIAASVFATVAATGPGADARQIFDPDRSPTIVAADEAFSFEFYASAALRAYPALSTFLLKRAGEDGQSFAADAARDFKEMGAEGYWRPRVLSLTDQMVFNGDGIVSVLRGRYMDGGGAHPNYDFETWLWATEGGDAGGRFLKIGALFEDGVLSDGFVQTWLRELSAVKKERLGENWSTGDEESIASTAGRLHETPFTLWPSTEPGKAAAIIFHHAPYDVGAYVEGSYDVTVPLSAFEADLSELGKTIFAGEPLPEED